MATEPDKLRPLIGRVADGKSVAWDDAEAAAASDEERTRLRHLRTVADVGRAYARPAGGERDPAGGSDPASGVPRDSGDDVATPGGTESPPRTPDQPGAGAGAGSPVGEGPTLPRIGRYRLSGEVGRGGMGIVWRGWDDELRRDVAIKFVPEERSDRREFRLRLLHEARTAAGLSHPNICEVFEVGETEEALDLTGGSPPCRLPAGTPFVVMQWIEGRTLARRIAEDGPLPPDELLDAAIGIADGLAAAHRRRVAHRDLSPRNVMIGASGAVKILDFGLARGLEIEPAAGPAPEDAARFSTQLTLAGKVMGTVAYMSPEQAEGKPVDTPSDVFSFGAVLYEMATGRRAFHGGTPASTIAKILERDPVPAARVNPRVPPALGPILSRCLRKEPRERFPSAEELRLELREARRRPDAPGGTSSPSGRRGPRLRRGIVRVAAGTFVLAAAVFVAGRFVDRGIDGLPASARAPDTGARSSGPDAVGVEPFVDEFDDRPSPERPGSYELLEYDPALWNPEIRDGFLALWTHRGDSWLKRGEWMPIRNVVGRPISGSRFQVLTRVADFRPGETSRRAGLLVFANQDNYLRLTAGGGPAGSRGTVSATYELGGEVLDQRMAGVPRPPATAPGTTAEAGRPVSIEQVWLKIVRDGDIWICRYSIDGIRFFSLPEFRMPLEPRYVGLVAFHGVSDEQGRPREWDPVPAHFDFLRIEPYP